MTFFSKIGNPDTVKGKDRPALINVLKLVISVKIKNV